MSNVEETRSPDITEAEANMPEKGPRHKHGTFDVEGVVPDEAVEA